MMWRFLGKGTRLFRGRTLPKTLALDPDNAASDSLCSFPDGLADNCTESSVIGTVTAVSPLLKAPLNGKVFFVKGIRADPKSGRLIKTLPTLLVELRGEININLRATTDVPDNEHLVTTFPLMPAVTARMPRDQPWFQPSPVASAIRAASRLSLSASSGRPVCTTISPSRLSPAAVQNVSPAARHSFHRMRSSARSCRITCCPPRHTSAGRLNWHISRSRRCCTSAFSVGPRPFFLACRLL